VQEIKARLEGSVVPVEEVLHRRGLAFRKANPTENLLLPDDISPTKERQFYEQMKRYSFRIFLREIITRRDLLESSRRRHFCSPETEEEYVEFLLRCGVLRRRRQGYELAKETVRSFGGTLEWFVAQVMEREFSCPALWGVKFDHLPVGGDYDVLSWLEGNLLYLELKSSPPKHIESSEVRSFLDRIEALGPNFAVMLVDTELRMRDKMVVLFEEQLGSDTQGPKAQPVRRIFGETFLIPHQIYLTNSKPSLISNLARVFRWHLGHKGDRFTEVDDD